MTYLLFSTAALLLGFCLDLVLGDPQGWPHIVRAMGALISALEKALYKAKNKRLGGAALAALTIIISTLLPAAVLFLAWLLSPWAYAMVETLLVWQLLATKSLRFESGRVLTALEKNDLSGARKAVSMIVGRDVDSLDAAGITRAAVETTAENASDGVVAPLIYIALGGAALGCFYKAVNTMDSMIGYKNDRYILFGRFAAKLDDVVNYIPARLCALVMILSSGICGFNMKNALIIWRRDRRKHASPNSAQTEAVTAGALGVRLAGDAYYFGRLVKKDYIGDEIRPIEPEDIRRAGRLLYTTAALTLFIAVILRGCIYAAL